MHLENARTGRRRAAAVLIMLCGPVMVAAGGASPNGSGEDPLPPAEFRQLVFDARVDAVDAVAWPSNADLREIRARSEGGGVPIAVLDAPVPDGNGVAVPRFAAAALKPWTYRGERVAFRVAAEAWVGGDRGQLDLQVDAGDGLGWRAVDEEGRFEAAWDRTGEKKMTLRASSADGSWRDAVFPFDVRALGVPVPDDTLQVTASVPYLGTAGTADAYVYRAPGHTTLVNPVVVVEGFDLENTYGWEELYTLLNQESLLETLRSRGFDAVVIDFDEGTDYLQRNAYVVVETLQQVEAMTIGSGDIALVGASMGGLLSRYALAWMEQQGTPANVRTFLSFDAPQKGANIPLGIQYWLDFFQSQSADAAYLLERLDTPGARQMLLYHHTTPPGTTGEADPLRIQFLADLAALGDWPAVPRLVSIANGSGAGQNQGFEAGGQLIQWEYSSLFVDIIGNVWAVPDGGPGTIFDGVLDIIFVPTEQMAVNVSGTLPWDSAPGGYRGSMATMDSVAAPFGDIVALHDNHCFIPTVSALALDVTDPFYDVAGDPDLMSITPFDAVYYPAANQEHVFIDAQNAAWFLSELSMDVTGVGMGWAGCEGGSVLEMLGAAPNPFRGATTLRFRLAAPRRVTVDVFDVAGRNVLRLLDGEEVSPGTHVVRWPPDVRGTRVPAGVYWVRMDTGDGSASRKVVRLD